MDLISRYIDAVVRQLPESERKEVEKEIQLLIDKMLGEYPGELSEEEKVKGVLEALGNPDALADRYRGKERYLIGPRYFSKYVSVLKIILLAGWIGMTVVSFIGGIIEQQDLVTMIANYCATVFEVLLQAAAWVTLIFALFEYKGVNLDKEFTWSIKDLPVAPSSKAVISKGESVFAIMISTIFVSILYFAPELMSVQYTAGNGVIGIPVFNLEVLERYKLLIVFAFLINVSVESLKIVWGTWNKKRAIVYACASTVSSALMIVFFAARDLWNSELQQAAMHYTGRGTAVMTKGIILLIVVVTLFEIGESLYKGFKYNKL
ncbi:MAG: hypothetical protein ACRCW2_15720 [Cellulosilyticaceae bacterium]